MTQYEINDLDKQDRSRSVHCCYVGTTQYINWRPSDLTDSWMGLSITYYLARLGSL